MPHRGDDRYGTGKHSPDHPFIVEGHQILHRAAAPAEDHRIEPVCQFAYSRKGSEQFGYRILALDCRREHSQLHRRTAPGNDMDHILERRSPC